MNKASKDQLRQWLENWACVGPELEQERYERVRLTNTPEAIEQLNDAFDWALSSRPMRESSGLLEQQMLFKQLHQKQ